MFNFALRFPKYDLSLSISRTKTPSEIEDRSNQSKKGSGLRYFAPFSAPARHAEQTGKVAGVVDVPVGGAHDQHRSHVVHATGH